MSGATARPKRRATSKRAPFGAQADRIGDRRNASHGSRENELLHAGVAALCRAAVGLVLSEVCPLAFAQDATSSPVVLAPHD